MCNKSFIKTFDEKPLFIKDYNAISNDFKYPKSLAIVMQGPIRYDNDFTMETIKLYLQNFPNCPIILSTWDYEDEKHLSIMENLGCIVVRNAIPEIQDYAHVNYQIKSTNAGLQKAKELGCTYVIKTRTDQRMYETNIAEFLFNVLDKFPLDSAVKTQKKRLITLSLNTFKYRLYDISDMFLFGHIDDVINFWNIPYETRTSFPRTSSLVEYAKQKPSEIGFTINYLEKMGENLNYTLKNSWEMYGKYFCVLDTNTVALYWPKYSNKINRWRNFFGWYPQLEELTFKEWFNIYANLSNIIVPDVSVIDDMGNKGPINILSCKKYIPYILEKISYDGGKKRIVLFSFIKIGIH